MSAAELIETATALVGGGKGLLAMDESNPTCDKRFAAVGIPQTVEMRRSYRELLITTRGLADCISGAILYDETIRQSDRHGRRFVDRLTDVGIIPGIKVDTGAKPLALHPGERITEGLDGLRRRLAEYAGMGARFAKWRAVIGLEDGQPSHYEGKTSSEIWKDRPGWNCYRDGAPGGESAGDVSDRADRLLARLCRLRGNVALFSHGEFGCSLAARWVGLPVEQGEHLQLGTASLSVLGFNPAHPGLPVIAHWNRSAQAAGTVLTRPVPEACT